jgi:D-amino peptidase
MTKRAPPPEQERASSAERKAVRKRSASFTMEEVMKVYISVDMEGIACVTHMDHIKLEGAAYEAARKWTTAEANAAIEGVLEAGADEIVVSDGHGKMQNLIPDELQEDITLVQGIPRPLLMMEGIDDTFNAALFVGYHARSKSGYGTLAHSFSGRLVNEVRLNQEPVSEAVFNAAVAGHFGVPVVLVSGDDKLAEEIAEKIPWAERVITKWAISGSSARNLTPKASQEKLRNASKTAISRIGSMKAFQLSSPIIFEVEFKSPYQVFLVSDIPGMKPVNSVTVSYSGTDMIEISRIWRLMLNACMSESPL